MTQVSRLRPYAGPALLSYGFRPFFLLGSIWAGLEVLAWPPMASPPSMRRSFAGQSVRQASCCALS